MTDYETDWTKEEKLLINLLTLIRIEEDPKKKEEYQKIIEKIIQREKNLYEDLFEI